jgi:hypothetical protein
VSKFFEAAATLSSSSSAYQQQKYNMASAASSQDTRIISIITYSGTCILPCVILLSKTPSPRLHPLSCATLSSEACPAAMGAAAQPKFLPQIKNPSRIKGPATMKPRLTSVFQPIVSHANKKHLSSRHQPTFFYEQWP